jgi:hypothetical protein
MEVSIGRGTLCITLSAPERRWGPTRYGLVYYVDRIGYALYVKYCCCVMYMFAI